MFLFLFIIILCYNLIQLISLLQEDLCYCCSILYNLLYRQSFHLQIKTALLLPLYLLYFIPFFCLTAQVNTSTMMLDRCGERGPCYPCLSFLKYDLFHSIKCIDSSKFFVDFFFHFTWFWAIIILHLKTL